MAIERKTVPYEYLVRFNADGSIRGQHIKYLDVLTDAGAVLNESEGAALAVGGADQAMLLDAALGEVAAGLSRSAEVAQLAQEAAEAKLAAALTDLAAMTAERDALVAATLA